MPGVLNRYRLHMQTIGGGDRGSMFVEVDMHVDMVGSAVGEIDRREGVSPKWPKTERPVLGIGLVSKPLREAMEKMC